MIFVFRIGSLGDSLVALPALYHIKKQHPREKIVLITNDPKRNYLSTWNIVKYTNIFDALMTYNGKQIISIIKLIRDIRKIKEKKTLYYLPPFRTKKQVKRDKFIFGFLAGIKKIIGLEEAIVKFASRNEKGKLLTLEKEYDRLLKVVLSNEEINQYVSFLPNAPLLIPTSENYDVVKKLFPDSFEHKTLIAIAHGTNMQAKKWDIENFSGLMKRLNQTNENLAFLLVGGAEDFQEGEQLKKEIGNCQNLAGHLSIIESAALLEKCDLFVGNDTGTMHLASVMGTPVIGIFSARDNPGKWEPYGSNYSIIRKNIECEGCSLQECIDEEKKCLTMISIEIVFNVVISYLSKEKS